VNRRLAVVGGDAAGMSAAANARRRDPDATIVVFDRGQRTSYSACGIPYYLGDLVSDIERLVARSPEEHRQAGIDVRLGHEVLGVDLDAGRLTVRDGGDGGGESLQPFDELVIATGARAVAPDLPGAKALEPVRTLDAAERLRSQLQAAGERAVVIGGGYIGVEMAEALVRRGLEVTLVDMADQLFAALDADMAREVQQAAEGAGIRVLLGLSVQEVSLGGDGRPRSVLTSDGELGADHVILATGVRPDVEVAQDAGLEVGQTGALSVDDGQRCTVGGRLAESVFAAGDCVESRHRLLDRPVNIQLGTHANKQGRIAGVNATGGDLRFPGVIGTAISRVCQREIARTGLNEREAAEAGLEVVAEAISSTTRAGYLADGDTLTVKVVAERGSGRLLGAQIVGAPTAGKRIDAVALAIWNGMTVEELQWADLAYAPPVSPVLDPILVAARAVAKRV